MKTTLLFLCIFALSLSGIGQDCFEPSDRYTLYTTDNPNYNLPSLSGFVTPNANLSGEWSVLSQSGGVEASFLDFQGRSASLEISGQGSIVIENVNTNVTTGAEQSCQHTFQVRNYQPIVVANPSSSSLCPLNMVIIIDESESLAAPELAENVRRALLTFVQNLEGSESRIALVEFGSKASNVSINGSSELQSIDNDFILSLDHYLYNDYLPQGNPSLLIGGTNWEDALLKANNVQGADFILLLTDSRPTFYNVSEHSGGSVIAGEGDQLDITALKEAVDVANSIKSSGKRIFVVVTGIRSTLQPVFDLSGPSEFTPDMYANEMLTTDYALVGSEELDSFFFRISSVCVPITVPTLQTWGIICVFLMIMIVGCVQLRQNEFVTSLTH